MEPFVVPQSFGLNPLVRCAVSVSLLSNIFGVLKVLNSILFVHFFTVLLSLFLQFFGSSFCSCILVFFRVGLAVSSLRPAVSSLKKFGLDPFLCNFLVLVLPSLFLQAFGLDLFSCILLGLVLLSLFLQSFLVVSQFSKSLRLNPFSCFEPAVSNLKKFWSRPFLVYFLVLVLPSLFLQVFGLDLFSCILLGLVLLSLFLQSFLVSTFFRAFFGCWFCCLSSPKNCV